MKYRPLIAAALLPLLMGGCVRTAASIVTFPVKAASKTVDWTTTSQSESDRNYGRKMRKQEAREGAERKRWAQECRKQQRPDCNRYDGYQAGR
ncbi:hypothetical protein [Sphingomonas glacialis]|uniref:Lipoprotein n=1 Tax=Sphingomonas glacialis TaxID=658225 RepID=A0A502G2R2_9SPHN|nr:hypothetical protein [Sphingomonas glacialis]TPG56075.1 hypothetical protein EAH76_00390 [Sphingomonas glacialis]